MSDFKPKTYRSKKGSVTVFHDLCKGCGLCVAKCPVGAISFSKTDLGVYTTPTVEIDMTKCIHCGLCETVCPDCALKVRKRG